MGDLRLHPVSVLLVVLPQVARGNCHPYIPPTRFSVKKKKNTNSEVSHKIIKSLLRKLTFKLIQIVIHNIYSRVQVRIL